MKDMSRRAARVPVFSPTLKKKRARCSTATREQYHDSRLRKGEYNHALSVADRVMTFRRASCSDSLPRQFSRRQEQGEHDMLQYYGTAFEATIKCRTSIPPHLEILGDDG